MQIGDTDSIGAVKIKDGLFMGDVYAAQDLELLVTNKVTHIINCAGRELPNHWEQVGVVYFTLAWQESDYQTLFEGRTDILTQLYKFIENALIKGESVLVHSMKGINRCSCVIAAYCMKKYRWTLYKTLEFIQSRKPNVAIRPNFFSQLLGLENRLARMGLGAKSFTWNEIGDNPKNLESDELLITNTFINSKSVGQAQFNDLSPKDPKSAKIVWKDEKTLDLEGKQSLVTVIPQKKKEKNFENPIRKMSNNHEEKKEQTFKSILKGSDKVFYLENSEKDKININKDMRNPGLDPNNFGAPITPGRKILGKLRPGSSMISNGRSQLLKSNSTSGLDKIDQEGNGSNIQGNIIHITVNNFITNSESQNKTKSKTEIRSHKDRKTGLSLSASSNDISQMLNRSNGLQSSLLFEKNHRDMPSLSGSQTVKVNNFTTKQPSNGLAILGMNTAKNDYSNDNIPSSVRKIGVPIKGFKFSDESKSNMDKNSSNLSPNTGMMKFISPGKVVPVRIVNDINVSSTPANFLPKKKGSRPLTAPNNPGRNLQNSPYYNPDNYPSRQSRERGGGSLQPNRGEPKSVVIKSKVRNPSPANSNYMSADNFFASSYRTKIHF